METIASLALNPRSAAYEKLSGQIDLHRVRCGNFRVVYEIVDNVLLVNVVNIGCRKNIYKKL